MPLTRTAGLIYLGLNLLAALLRTTGVLAVARLMLKPTEAGPVVEAIGQPVKTRFETIWKKFYRRFFRLICYTMPIYILIFVAQQAGFFNWLREATANLVSVTFLPVESASVVIFSVAAEFSSGIAAAGALLSSGALTVQQTVAALILGLDCGHAGAGPAASTSHARRHFLAQIGDPIVVDQPGAAHHQPDSGYHPVLMVGLRPMSSPGRHRSLRTGFSTGTAAAGAVTAALLALAEREAPASLEVPLPGGGFLTGPGAPANAAGFCGGRPSN